MTTFIIGLAISLLVSGWVFVDARKHQMRLPLLWAFGTFMVLIVVLPAYFIVRYQRGKHTPTPTPPPPAP
jgi:hypothetical protein